MHCNRYVAHKCKYFTPERIHVSGKKITCNWLHVTSLALNPGSLLWGGGGGGGGGGGPRTHCSRMCQNFPEILRFRFFHIYNYMYCTCKLSVTLSTLPLFATLAGVCHHEKTWCRLLLSWQGSRASWKPKLQEIRMRPTCTISDLVALYKLSSLFKVLNVDDYFLASLFHTNS